ncbi:ComF family protein [Paenibacillus sp. S150]|uniref:ComF family protein n=1 Tax=Paenibacillus sp. S150 TaxID=2749826 RepID=UPI001C59A290|nr:ComF family protein [Paenibacillus sp. S150]MBW4081675.1 ComF family protein [Paenibacillus sp. S150]
MNTWLKIAQSLLAPSASDCPICGKKCQASSELPGVCKSCMVSIPWIRNPRCSKCGRHVGCPDCSRGGDPVPIVCNRSAVAYTSVMRELLGQYKYRGDERLAPILGLMLDQAYTILQAEQERMKHYVQVQRQLPVLKSKGTGRAGLWQADLLVPVPVSGSRLAERGFNQAERLAGVLSGSRGIPQLPLLVRTHHTGKQSFKSRAERLADMKHAFAANPDPAIGAQFACWLDSLGPLIRSRPLQIIIIDDIYTTGSTVRACAETLKILTKKYSCIAEIYSLTWARS